MPNLTETRMREILSTILRDDAVLDSYVCDAVTATIINHPEVKSLFEKKSDDEDCKDCGNMLMDEQEHCDRCNKPICESCGLTDNETHTGTFCRECCEPTEATKEREPEYEVIEYTFLSNADFSHFDTPCNNDGQIRFIGGISCEACKHFAGYETYGKSIRCMHKHNEGEV